MKIPDPVIYETDEKGKFRRTAVPIKTTAEHTNFVIICPYGDWSGFRTLIECQSQFAELEEVWQQRQIKVPGARTWYKVVERL